MHMRVGIYLNDKYQSQKQAYFDRVNSALSACGAECISVDNVDLISTLDILIVIGGDGTILSVACECAKCGVKILGINGGHLGFLTDYEAHQLDYALQIIKCGKFNTVKRSILTAEYCGREYFALNEVVIQRCTTGNAFTNTISLHAEIDGKTVDNFTADGLIISTPTGSTAYSLSAGGSILTPDLKAFIITPVCPHSLHSRPIVFNDDSVVCINQYEKNCLLNLIVDGKVVENLNGFNKITIKKADYCAEFISETGNNFFDKLLIKLNIWSK